MRILNSGLAKAKRLPIWTWRLEGVMLLSSLTLFGWARMPAFRFEVEGQKMFTWCAWDALFIPELIGQTAHVESICPITKETIQLKVTPSGVTEITPTSAVMSYVETEADNLRADVIKSFCHNVLFFSSEEAGSQWIKDQEGMYSLFSIEDAFRLGQVKNQIQYKESLLAA